MVTGRHSFFANMSLGFSAVMAMTVAAMASPALGQPSRVVSLNVCTDQLAMLIAGEGQLVSVSHLALDPSVSAMAEAAREYAVNHGSAEEVFMMKPDLVLAGTYTTASTVNLLRKLGIRVEEFAPATSLENIREDIRRMGELLHRKQRAESILSDFDAELAALMAQPPTGKTVALYYANSDTSGGGTLVDAIVEIAGFENIGRQLGLVGTTRLSLEDLILADPDIVVLGGHRYSTPALAEANFSHPAFEAFMQGRIAVSVPPPVTICGGPVALEAARALRTAAQGENGT